MRTEVGEGWISGRCDGSDAQATHKRRWVLPAAMAALAFAIHVEVWEESPPQSMGK